MFDVEDYVGQWWVDYFWFVGYVVGLSEMVQLVVGDVCFVYFELDQYVGICEQEEEQYKGDCC